MSDFYVIPEIEHTNYTCVICCWGRSTLVFDEGCDERKVELPKCHLIAVRLCGDKNVAGKVKIHLFFKYP